MNEHTLMGLEVELQYCARSAIECLKGKVEYNIHDDGSIRVQTYTIGGFAVIPQRSKRGDAILSLGMDADPRPYGLELATIPYPYVDMRNKVAPLLSRQFRHVPQTARSSIHVHVDNRDVTWRETQLLLTWIYHLEAVLYRLACGGQTHRGERSFEGDPNDHRYARPLSNPIGIRASDGDIHPILDIQKIMNATSASSMMHAWGRLDHFWQGLQHYCPHRLMMVNLASIPRLGTFEWRLFDPMYESIPLIVDVVAAVHRLAHLGVRPDFQPMLLGTVPTIGDQPVTCSWVSNLLNLDVSKLWGMNWPRGCIREHRESHYPRMEFPSLTGLVQSVSNNEGERDKGGDNFCFCRRN